MFTGIVEEIGTVVSISQGAKAAKMTLQGNLIFEDMHIGDSIAVNGVCLTVTSMSENGFCADVMAETVRKSSLGILKSGDSVNLERAMAANGRFGGHIVSGHIDGTGTICQFKKEQNAVWITIEASPEILHLIVHKGSICIDGVSLTVAELSEQSFSVSIIPHTGEQTILLKKKVGDIVNLENDVIGKYVQRLLAPHTVEETPASRITLDLLSEYGF